MTDDQHESDGRDPIGDELQLASVGMLPDGYTTIRIPPDFLCREDRLLWARVTASALLGLPPSNPVERLIRGVLDDLRKTRDGKKMKVAAVLVCVRLAIAQTHGIKVQTHLRGVALHLGVRYQTLLKIRALALKRIESENIRLDMPEWLTWDWS